LKKSLKDKLNLFCDDCRRRYRSNPLRILDCKVPSCIKNRKGSPSVIDLLCVDCSLHFDRLKHNLEIINIPFIINPNIVRGLDYYTRTTFEVTSGSLGSQNAVAAGGRYDGLVNEFGGPPVSGIGFAIGVERIIPLVRESIAAEGCPDLFFCTMGDETSEKGFILAEQLRAEGFWVEMNYDSSSLKSQMRKAGRIGAKNVIVIGEDEMSTGKAVIKNMQDKKTTGVSLDTGDIAGKMLRKSRKKA
jgi:histidyl-tRNA synthetase